MSSDPSGGDNNESALVSTKELAHLFAYPSVDALRRSIERGHFPIPVVKIPHRRGLFALRTAVNEHLKNLEESATRPG